MQKQKNVWKKSIDQIMNDGFARYAKYIIQDRALPDIRDGLKPVQRRILFAMNNLGILHDKPYKKSARTVGEVIGKYHPHGDSSIYESMVRMSQEWKNNIPLLDMHGNKGSIDGDNAAAMRYTECRLSKISEFMLVNIDKNTVNFIPNFDDSEKEPSYLPSLIPNLLVNGATGIAAGYATNIPPFNFVEVIDSIIHRIDNPNCCLDSIIKIMPGPDFPTGGTIQGAAGIREAYETGKGKFIIRANFEERVVNKKIKQLVITSIPYETNKSAIIKSIDDLMFNEKISGIIETRDESDKNGISIVIDIEADKSFDVIKNFLLKNTSLQVTYAINFIVIHNRKPCLMPILEALDAYIAHAIDITTKTLMYDLDKAVRRLEIVKGLMKAISILDDIISTIRKSQSKDDSKKNIMAKFGFSEVQAEAIVNLRLYKLSATDIATLKQEEQEVEGFIKNTKMILSSDELLRNYIKKILREYKNIFGYERRTKIEDEIEKIIINDADLLDGKDVIVMVTKDGYIKTTTRKSICSSTYGEFSLKSGDVLLDIFDSNTLDYVIIITSLGRYISIPCHKIKNSKYKDLAEHINNLITLETNEKIVSAFNTKFPITDDKLLLIATKNGLVKRTNLNELVLAKSPKSLGIINLRENDLVVSAQLVSNNTNYEVISVTKNGYGIKYNIDEIPIIGRVSSGVKSQKLYDNDCIATCIAINNENQQIVLVANRGMKRIYANDIKKIKRAGTGIMLMSQVKSQPYEIINAFSVFGTDTLNVLSDDGSIKFLKASLIPLTDLSTRFSDLKFNRIISCYRDNWLSRDIGLDNDRNSEDSSIGDEPNVKQEKLF